MKNHGPQGAHVLVEWAGNSGDLITKPLLDTHGIDSVWTPGNESHLLLIGSIFLTHVFLVFAATVDEFIFSTFTQFGHYHETQGKSGNP